jgi:sialate O-acetylesterase
MVMQRGIKATVWGWTDPGKKVTVSMSGKTAQAVADTNGRWQVKIGPFAAGGPFTLTVSGLQLVTVNDVLVGDVWICSGQSNMEFSVASSNNGREEIAKADHPQIRLFAVPKRIAFEPKTGVSSQWQTCSPATIGPFSAVGYFFGRCLNQELHVPIGLINTSWGGTVAEAWISTEALKTLPDFKPQVESIADLIKAVESGEQAKLLDRWYQAKDPGTAKEWYRPDTDVTAWKQVKMPNAWESAGLPEYDGMVWFQRAFDAPAAWASKELVLSLGPIDDYDTTWVNSVKVGGMDLWNAPRVYKVPGDLVKEGRNVITIRVLDTGGAGGLTGTSEQMKVYPSGNEASAISLAGPWRMQDVVAWAKIQPVPMTSTNNPNICTVLYNGMIEPLVPFAVKGAIWYQGESNAGRAYQYRTLMPTLIKDWKKRFGVKDFGFHIVSLANYLATSAEPREDEWAELREAQALTTKAVPNCGIAMAIDIGDANDIHPRNKQEVGRRLALSALGVT